MNGRNIRVSAVIADLFGGAMGVAGGIGLVGGGLQFPLDWLRGTPFSDYTAPGLILGLAVGGSGLAAGLITALSRRAGVGVVATGIAGCIMLGWIVGEYALLGYVSWMQPAFFAVGLLQLGLAVGLSLVTQRQRQMTQGAAVQMRPHHAA